jgi:uncharacterized repeat protein (TIGR01451 family)
MRSIALVALTLALLPVAARAAAHVELINSAAAIESHDGAFVAMPLGGGARPGERLRYTIVAKNTGDRPAIDLVPVAKIPPGERLVDGTAGPDAEFSVDGGTTWSREPTVRVTNPGGTTAVRRALASEIDAIRWVDPVPLAPGARASFAYDVIVE